MEASRQCQSVMTEDADLELLQDHEQSIRKLEVGNWCCGHLLHFMLST